MIPGIENDARKLILQGFGHSNFVEFDGGIFAAHKNLLKCYQRKTSVVACFNKLFRGPVECIRKCL